MPLGSIRCHLLCGLYGCQGKAKQGWKNQVAKEKGVLGPSCHFVRIVNNTTVFVSLEIFLFCKQTVKCCLLSHLLFLHQILRHLTQKSLSDTPNSQHCEKRGIHCPGLCLSPRQHMYLIHKKAFILALLILKKSSSYSALALEIIAFKQSREQILITWVVLKSSNS